MLKVETTGIKFSVSCGWMDQQLRLIQYLCPAKRERTDLQRRSFHVISTDVDEQAFAPEDPDGPARGLGRTRVSFEVHVQLEERRKAFLRFIPPALPAVWRRVNRLHKFLLLLILISELLFTRTFTETNCSFVNINM